MIKTPASVAHLDCPECGTQVRQGVHRCPTCGLKEPFSESALRCWKKLIGKEVARGVTLSTPCSGQPCDCIWILTDAIDMTAELILAGFQCRNCGAAGEGFIFKGELPPLDVDRIEVHDENTA